MDEISILLWYNFAMRISGAGYCVACYEKVPGHVVLSESEASDATPSENGEIGCFAPAQHDTGEMVFNGFNP